MATPSPQISKQSRDPWLPMALVTAVLAIAVRLHLMVSTGSTAEDFYISLRYAENLATGHGFVYSAGEHVLGTTTPLYTLWLAALRYVGLNPVPWGKVTNILAEGVSCVLVYRLARSAGRPGAGAVAAALLALSPPNLTWAVSGMETGLVTAFGLAVLVAAAERRRYALGILGATLILLRIDGAVVVLIGLGALWVSSRRPPWISATLLLILIAPWFIFSSVHFGSPLPASATAKLVVYAWHAREAWPNLAPFTRQMSHSPLHWLLLVGAVAGVLCVATRDRRLVPAALWMLMHYAAMAFSKVFLFGWYYIPPSPLYFLLSALGWIAIVNRALALTAPKADPYSSLRKVAGLVPVLVLLVGIRGVPGVRAALADEQQTEDRLRKSIGLQLREVVRGGGKLMLEPIGYIGYFSRANVLDAVGLVSPEALRFYRKGATSPYLDMMAELKPEFVLLRTGEYHDAMDARVPSDRSLLGMYVMLRTFSDPAAPADSEPAFFLLKRR